MVDTLFTIRAGREEDRAALDELCLREGMDEVPSIEHVRVAVHSPHQVIGFIRIARDDKGIAFVNPVITHEAWRGFGVGRALMEEALAQYGELRLVARGKSVGFYKALGFKPLAWEGVKMDLVEDCDACELRDECHPQPLVNNT